MIPDFKQQISELEKQKQDLEIRLNEQTENMKGKPSPQEPACRSGLLHPGKDRRVILLRVSNSDLRGPAGDSVRSGGWRV